MTITNFTYNPNAKYLFNRTWSVALGAPGQAAALEYTQLRTKFEIDKNALGTSNKSKIELYNLSTQSRQSIKKGWNIRLQVGYAGVLETLFLGGVIPNGIGIKRDGPDVITSMECGDGEASIVFGTFDKSYPAGVTLVQMLQDLAVATGLGMGVAIGIPAVSYNRGHILHGQIRDSLDNLCKSSGLIWSVNNGNLNIVPVKSSNGQSAIVLSPATGLIGIPSSDGGFTRFSSLLNPKIVPEGVVQLLSENTSLNGFYKVKRAKYLGDTHDSKWQVDCEGIPLPNVRILPQNKGFNFSTAVSS